MRLLIFGGRDFKPSTSSDFWLEDTFADWDDGEITVISGGARGADQYGEAWAEMRKHDLVVYHANWIRDGKKAGILRNIRMLEEGKPDYAVQFPGGRGTAHMRSILDKAGIKVWEYHERT